ncbi:MAG: phosphoribosylformimino-5-aminoimidazole carboxamide ribotide isomerase [bacterium]|nr:phosphoribosylformimino-5-aminoimidazole carboxamide ribotide isomerase [bacterium]MDY4100741.1 phosphoribosylformimino-5-aminoimidazole carboxamide ribotide isomerase [Lachnospiraceae bacterium]
MEFRPCIDIHNGKVKQIVGKSLRDEGNLAAENFVSERSAEDFARLYQAHGLRGGHVILLNARDSEYYEATKAQALSALLAYPGGLQVGGGVTADNAAEFIRAGASHVIVTSYVFSGGEIRFDRLEQLKAAVGREHLVLDMSCKKCEDAYVVVTDRWQKLTREQVTPELLDRLSEYADEFLIHAVDVEGQAKGIEEELVAMLGAWCKKKHAEAAASESPGACPAVTYAGGVGGFADLEALAGIGGGYVNVTIGSALDLFGGRMDFEEVIRFCQRQRN